MGVARISLGREHADAIRAAAKGTFPLECCGLLIGTRGTDHVRIHTVVPVPNTAIDPARHFEIDPQILFDHMRSVRQTKPGWKLFKFAAWFSSLFGRADAGPRAGMQIVGHYHSHPNGRSTPSAEDLRMAHDRAAVWIIAAVDGNAAGLRAFVPAETGFVEIALET